jgi:hypothetical protein
VREDFLKQLLATAQAQDWKDILENKCKFMLVHSSSGHKYAPPS